jgi:ADP-heptose:LPS heptosyltransferase
MTQAIAATIQQQYPNVVIDLVVAEGDLTRVAEIFNARVWSDRRFG